MVVTYASPPAPPLQRFIKRYCLREIDTAGADLLKPLFADDNSILALSLTDTPVWYHTPTASRLVDLRDRHLFGLQTAFNGYQVFNGKYKLLCIEFNANGFFSLFHVPMTYVRNNLWRFDDVVGQDFFYLSEQLYGMQDFSEIVSLMDIFFMQAFTRTKAPGKYTAQIAWAYRQLVGNYATEVRSLAGMVNMSLRNFEQQFTAQIGMTPVLLKRIKRFHGAVALKAQNPDQSWTSIAYDCNYFDQMHLIKDFKVFSSMSPKTFFRQMPPPRERVVLVG
ncbi:helix-turn-helix domain-containing protein [Chitinophaga flava]|uniref:HTH araC/xylS-type domain-containing protein n=1 Tax=Chitinophaga flava TaxID=2259036 RepID=A0A365XZE1_9BACT|nr:AraC family transcriptional regulator [Chitinophaga flava]RBL91756.1 hypothetical protein DF182_03885 [Chitinophaga flava]